MLLLLWLLCGIVLVVYLVVSGVISFCLLVLVCACYLVRGFGVSWFCLIVFGVVLGWFAFVV